MKPDPKEEHKKHTFDTYCKRILKNESSDYHRRLNVLMKHEIPLSELPQEILQQLAVWDEYFKDTYRFEAKGFEIFVADGLLAEALKTLPQDRLEIVLLLILSILVYTFFSRMFDLMLPPVAKHSIVVA